jgi:hypothetical protein
MEMLVTTGLHACSRLDELIEAGFDYSVMPEKEPGSPFELGAWIDAFSDWGWSGDEQHKPGWMRDPEP